MKAADVTLPETTAIFWKEIECLAREARFGGTVVQPLEAWQAKVKREE